MVDLQIEISSYFKNLNSKNKFLKSQIDPKNISPTEFCFNSEILNEEIFDFELFPIKFFTFKCVTEEIALVHDEISKFFEKFFWNNNKKQSDFFEKISGEENPSGILKFVHFHNPKERR